MRLVKANSLAPSPRLYLFSIKSYGQKTYVIMTRFDVIRPLYVFAHNRLSLKRHSSESNRPTSFLVDFYERSNIFLRKSTYFRSVQIPTHLVVISNSANPCKNANRESVGSHRNEISSEKVVNHMARHLLQDSRSQIPRLFDCIRDGAGRK